MIGATWQDTAAAVFTNQKELDNDLFPRMLGWQTTPPGKATHAHQPGTIIKNISPTDPGDFVTHHPPISYQPLLQVERVSRVIHFMAFPGNCSRPERFGADPARPDFDILLVRANIIEVAQTCCRTTNKTTTFSL